MGSSPESLHPSDTLPQVPGSSLLPGLPPILFLFLSQHQASDPTERGGPHGVGSLATEETFAAPSNFGLGSLQLPMWVFHFLLNWRQDPVDGQS